MEWIFKEICKMLKFFKHLFFREEAQEYVEMGALNALFVLGRSMGFIGEFFSFQVFDLVISRKKGYYTDLQNVENGEIIIKGRKTN